MYTALAASTPAATQADRMQLPVQCFWQRIPIDIKLVVCVLGSGEGISVAAVIRNKPAQQLERTINSNDSCSNTAGSATRYSVMKRPSSCVSPSSNLCNMERVRVVCAWLTLRCIKLNSIDLTCLCLIPADRTSKLLSIKDPRRSGLLLERMERPPQPL